MGYEKNQNNNRTYGGNNSIKLVTESEKEVNYENIYCDIDKEKIEKEYKRNGSIKANKFNIATMLDVKVTSKAGEERTFIFGKKAERYRTEATERINNYKSDDSQLVYNSIVALANTVVSELDFSKLEGEEELLIEASICTGLPFHEYETADRKEKYAKFFKGSYSIEFLNPSYPIKKVTVALKNVELEIEGLSALRQTLFDENVLENEGILEKVVAMIDIGCYTTDIIGGLFYENFDDDGNLAIGFDTQSDLCQGIINGVGTALDNVISKLKSKYSSKLGQYGDFTRQEIIKAAENENKLINGTEFSIEPFYTDECSKLGSIIGEKFAQLYDASGYKNKILYIYLAGGGSFNKTIVEDFKEKIEQKGFDINNVKLVKSPVYANAKGYFNIADFKYGEVK